LVAQATALDDLHAIIGNKHAFRPDEAGRFVVDGISPQAVVEPGSYEEVAAVIRYASEAGLAVIPLAGGTKRHVGNLPRRYDVALSLSRLDKIIEHEPADLTVTCQAGISIAELQQRLKAHGQRVPFNAGSGHQASVGGVLAANANGPSRAAYGALRDYTIGMRVVTADGRITRAGGKVVKNVAGYDLCKLYTGSLGTLGVIVEATFKVMPVSRRERSIALRLRSPSDACRLAAELYRRGLAFSHVELSSAGGGNDVGWFLEILLAGSQGAVDRSEKELLGLAPRFKAELAASNEANETRSAGESNDDQLLCRLSVLASQLAALIEEIKRLESPLMVAEPITGVLRASWPAVDAAAVLESARAVAAKHEAVCVVEHCSVELKRRIDVFGDPPPAFALMRRVKQQFDPKGILSPGRFVGRL